MWRACARNCLGVCAPPENRRRLRVPEARALTFEKKHQEIFSECQEKLKTVLCYASSNQPEVRMSEPTLEQRVKELEEKVAELIALVVRLAEIAKIEL